MNNRNTMLINDKGAHDLIKKIRVQKSLELEQGLYRN